mgnify:FL=1
MCVAAVAWDCHPDLLLVAVANRDEFHARPAVPLEEWSDDPGVLAGRDLRSGGTWLGVSRQGQFALLTNFRDPDGFAEGRPSRGSVVTDLLKGREPAGLSAMNPLNACHATPHDAYFLTNYPGPQYAKLDGGIHGLSNGAFDKPWPKTRQLGTALGAWLKGETGDVEPLFAALRSETPRADEPAPLHAPEPGYAPIFISNPTYGTRCSTVVTIARDGTGMIAERSFDPQARPVGERRLAFAWPV